MFSNELMKPPDEILAIDRVLASIDPIAARGRVHEVLGPLIKAGGLRCSIGEVCGLVHPEEGAIGRAEVVGFSGPWTMLSALDTVRGLSPYVEVVPGGRPYSIGVGEAILGRVLDGFGTAIDGRGDWPVERRMLVDAPARSPLERTGVTAVFETGVRAIDTMLTCGVGQRIGVFAPAGVGKSSLIGGLLAQDRGQPTVVALIGERGREVGDFLRELSRTPVGRRTVVVAATSDRPAIERLRAAQVATTIAEYFRDRGESALLLVDSLTRLARAQREIGLAVGEPPTRRGYPSSVFALLPRLLERAGPGKRGAITAFYTVLTEGDELDDPIAEEVRAILDGHIVMRRDLADAGHYPAIDLLASHSRLANALLEPAQLDISARARALMAAYDRIRLLVQIGEYRRGTDARSDRALDLHEPLQRFFRQPRGDDVVSLPDAFARLAVLIGEAP